jgi:hypothetical protein
VCPYLNIYIYKHTHKYIAYFTLLHAKRNRNHHSYGCKEYHTTAFTYMSPRLYKNLHRLFLYLIAYAAATFSFLDLTQTRNTTGTNSVAARSKAWVCDRSLAGIAGSNPTRHMDVCLF